MDLPTQHSLWLSDPVTIRLLDHLDKEITRQTQIVFTTRLTDPTKLADTVASLELATALREKVKTGKF